MRTKTNLEVRDSLPIETLQEMNNWVRAQVEHVAQGLDMVINNKEGWEQLEQMMKNRIPDITMHFIRKQPLFRFKITEDTLVDELGDKFRSRSWNQGIFWGSPEPDISQLLFGFYSLLGLIPPQLAA